MGDGCYIREKQRIERTAMYSEETKRKERKGKERDRKSLKKNFTVYEFTEEEEYSS